jgi:hypothetical protein
MPKASEHKTKATHNRQFLNTIAIPDYPDWAAVVAFYTAVHLVERVRAAAGHGHSRDHDDRLSYVANNLETIHTAYTILQNVSMLARYESRGDFFKQFQPEDVESRLIGQYLTAIDTFVSERLDK